MLPGGSGTDIEVRPIMAEDPSTSNVKPSRAAEPPGGGRQTHEAMQGAAMRPVSGPASTDVLAAGGGLEVPGGDPDASAALAPTPHDNRPLERFPGEREADTLTHREPGAIGGQFNGADIPAQPPGWVEDDLARARAEEAGGTGKGRRDGRRS